MNKWLILAVVSIPTIMIEMAGTSVFIAFEVIATELNVGMESSVWLTTLYLAANAMMIPLSSWLGKKMGYKRVILSGVAVFTLSSLLCALAGDFHSLVVFRALQGLGDGPIMPVVTALLFDVFPPKQRGRMMAGMMLAYSIAPALGPLITSWLIDSFEGWRAIFFMNVIWGMVSILAVSLFLPAMKPTERDARVNWPAFILLAIGTVSLQLFLDRGEQLDWFASDLILAAGLVAAVSLILYLVVAFATKDDSVLALGLLKKPSFLAGNIAMMTLMGSLYGALVTKVFYLQWIMGFTVLQSGLYQALLAGAMFASSVIAGVLTDKINPRWLVIVGLPIAAYALLLSTGLGLTSAMNDIMTIGAVLGTGLAFIVTPVSVTVFSSIRDEDMAGATVMNSYLSVVGGSVSLALLTILLVHRMDANTMNLFSAIAPCNPAIVRALSIQPEAALAAAYKQVARQGAMFGFVDTWHFMAFAMVSMLLYVPFMERASGFCKEGGNVQVQARADGFVKTRRSG